MIYGHGSDASCYDKEIKADFSSNVWFEGPSIGLIQHLARALPDIGRYPDAEGANLRDKIAGSFGLSSSNIMVTNGSVEAFYLLALLYKGRESVILYPGFAEYEDACRIHGHKTSFYSNQDNWWDQSFGDNLVWLGNPNNPDGKTISPHVVSYMLKKNPNTMFIVDEAYAELCTEYESSLSLVNDHTNLVIIRSFTKSFAIPGLRLGCIFADNKLIQHLQALRMPWSVNTPALEAGQYILDHYNQLLPDKSKITRYTSQFNARIDGLEGFSVIPTACNYFLVKLQHGTSHEIKQYLIDHYGLLIRDASNFRGLDNSYIRLAVQHSEYNKELAEGLKTWIRMQSHD